MARSHRRGWRTRTLATVAMVGLLAACGSNDSTRDTAPTGGADGSASPAETAENPFKGTTVDFVVPYEPGGGYDAYARAMAPFFEKCLDGATVVIRNEPGAGGLRATNQTAAAPADANRFQIVNTVGLVSAQIAKAAGAQFDLNDLNWIGRVSAPPNVVVVATNSPIKDFSQLISSGKTVRFVAQGPGANDFIAPNILSAAYDVKFDIVTGFAGSAEARTAVVAGNADAHILPVDSQLPAIKSGDVRPLVTIDEDPDSLLPDTPVIYDTPTPNAAGKEVLDNLVALGQTGRGLIASPKMEADRVEALRSAFTCVADNPEAVSVLDKQNRPLNALGGQETADLVKKVLDAPATFQKLIVESY